MLVLPREALHKQRIAEIKPEPGKYTFQKYAPDYMIRSPSSPDKKNRNSIWPIPSKP